MKIQSLTGEIVEIECKRPDRICDYCLHEVDSICKIYGNERDFDSCVNFKWNMSKIPCDSCKHIEKMGGQTICDNSCGLFPINSGHPLAPCNNCYPDFNEDGEYVGDSYDAELFECEVDEFAIREGGRCCAYIRWLRAMADKEVKE